MPPTLLPKPGDPSNPVDMLGTPIHDGDFAVWATALGRSATVTAGIIEKIIGKADGRDVPLHQADRYVLRMRPLVGQSYGLYPSLYEAEEVIGGYPDPYVPSITRYLRPRTPARPTTLTRIERVVRVSDVDPIKLAYRERVRQTEAREFERRVVEV